MLVDVNIGVRLHGSVAAPAALLSRDGNKAGKEVLTSHSDAFALLPASSLKSTEILILIFISRGLILWSIHVMSNIGQVQLNGRTSHLRVVVGRTSRRTPRLRDRNKVDTFRSAS
jgi:hypothetical protein